MGAGCEAEHGAVGPRSLVEISLKAIVGAGVAYKMFGGASTIGAAAAGSVAPSKTFRRAVGDLAKGQRKASSSRVRCSGGEGELLVSLGVVSCTSNMASVGGSGSTGKGGSCSGGEGGSGDGGERGELHGWRKGGGEDVEIDLNKEDRDKGVSVDDPTSVERVDGGGDHGALLEVPTAQVEKLTVDFGSVHGVEERGLSRNMSVSKFPNWEENSKGEAC